MINRVKSHADVLLLGTFLAICAWGSVAADEQSVPDFAKHIQPIFAEHCHACHGVDLQESNYRLDVRSLAFGEGDVGRPIVKGNSETSPLIRYVRRLDESMSMPPEDEGDPLLPEQVDILRRWIDVGAPWPDELAGDASVKPTTDHWSLQPVTAVEPPQLDASWPSNAIDQFVLAQLNDAGLQPSPPADRATFLRRLYLDVHGLVPTPEQLDEFQGDASPAAFKRVIDSVLESPRYGERWARHWLDVARFGESTGYEVNRDRENAYHYRDYVIGSLNGDKPFRDFVIEQLAGDAVGQDVGTGFLVGGPFDMVKSPDVNLTLMQRQDELADYVNTTATAFLGMTVGCARCHNHKFDPILQKDYYAMQAVFAGVEHGEREIASADSHEAKARIEELVEQRNMLAAKIAALRELAQDLPGTSAKTREAVRHELNVEDFDPIEAKFVRFTVHGTSGAEPCLDELEIFGTDNVNVGAAVAGAKATASGTLPGYAIHKLHHINDGKYGNAHSWISNTRDGGWIQIELARPTMINRIRWGRDRTGQVKDRLATDYVVESALEIDAWNEIASSKDRLARDGKEAPTAFIERLDEERRAQATKLFAESKSLDEKIKKLRENIPKAYVGTFKKPEPIHRLYRGDPLSPREVVLPDTLSVVSSLGLTNETSERDRRLALAKWIASDDNPLTARVIVNRVWHYHFGTGVVSTPSDFGKNGGLPSHPELLDWLAWNFMQNEWSLKWLHRQILSSATYRQSSSPRPEAIAKDADSQLLWRFPPRRLEAEAIRDCMLQVSGALEHRGGGPGFLLLDIEHENVHHYFPKQSLGPDEFRRMIYMTKIRQEQDSVFGVFDCPDGGQVIPNRNRSTTPLQALNLLNSQFVLDQSVRFAARVERGVGSLGGAAELEQQVRQAFLWAYNREPTDRETTLATGVAKQHGLAAVCRAIFNSNEFLFVP